MELHFNLENFYLALINFLIPIIITSLIIIIKFKF